MKILKKTLLSLLVLIFLALLVVYLWLRTTAPTYEGELQLNGLQQEVKVVFDDFGVPHIYAQNASDAYISLGYIHAQERLFQMEMIRRATSGTLSEILGASLVETDKTMRTLSIRKAALRSASLFFDQIDEPFKEQTLAYLKGINAFIDEDNLPVEFRLIGFKPEHFTPEDVYTTIGYMSLSFTSAISEEPIITRIFEQLGNDYLIDFSLDSLSHDAQFKQNEDEASFLTTLFDPVNLQDVIPVPIWEGSNNWVLGKDKSLSGKALLANDTHIAYSQPAVWYEAHLNYPGFEMFGYYLAGVPYAVIGHNDLFAWGITIFPYDNMDLFREKQNPDNPNQVWAKDHWENYISDPQTIKVKGGDDVIYALKYTRHGPIINEVYEHINSRETDPVSLWWSLHTLENRSLEALYHMNNAKGLCDFQRGIEMVDIIGQNILYADSNDNIAWWATGKIPIRAATVNSKIILDGSSGENEIVAYYPFKDNPQLINPESGFIATANNAPHRINGIIYPGYYAPGLRLARINEKLRNRQKWDLESMSELQLDNLSERDTMLTHLILKKINLNEIKSEGETWAQALKVLADWDGRSEVSSLGSTIYNKLLYHVLLQAMADELGTDYFNKVVSKAVIRGGIQHLLTNEQSVWWDNILTTDRIETRDEAFEAAIKAALASLSDQFGDQVSSWRWGKVHTLTHVHPVGQKKPFDLLFNVGPFEKSGSNDVIDKESFRYNATGIYPVGTGPAMRFLIDFADTKQARSIIPTGQSGNIFSPHYDDQARMFVEGSYRHQSISGKELEGLRTLLLKP